MAFSDETVAEAWERSNGKCECERKSHVNHFGKHCNKELVIENHGRESGRGAWEANHKTRVESGGDDTLSNCEILCWDCHKQTL